jgi:hypothetical protein
VGGGEKVRVASGECARVVGERQRQRERATEGEIGSWERVSGGGEKVRVASAREWWVCEPERQTGGNKCE